MRLTTTKCKAHGHLEISFECDEAPFLSEALKFLLDWIETEVERGRKFIPEQTVQIGWSLLEIRQRRDGSLALFEPDFDSMPTKFIDSVSNTLRHLLLHKYVAESIGLVSELTFPDLRHSVVVCKNFGSARGGFLMDRVSSLQPSDSGWFLGCTVPSHNHQEHHNLKRVSVYEAAVCLDNRIIPFLALPPGTLVDFSAETPRFFRIGTLLSIRPGSYLAEKYRT